VSHDRYFINRIANRVLEMRPDGVSEYIGNYNDYLEKKRLEDIVDDTATLDGKTRTQMDKEKRRARLMLESKKALSQRVAALEKSIAEAESELLRLESAMADPDVYKDPERAKALALEHTEARQLLDRLYEDWTEASEASEEVK
jgi:ATP-binding cassette subfamily F protein 3